ncbi:hypothetical protein PAPYR_12282 [Paratrimastix pyriformis]|uniref:Uncharacterized protein n=1 Tax=Paratrimastix pyriformis TaxID=342808 RepID=A0ABQ8U619_9EUKA|nr:hypothetical protein PAPYR_12282 [Paratrimastix pyriformis]
MRAHLGGLPWKLKKRRFANGCVKRTRVRSFGSSLLASRVHGVSHSTDRSGEDRPLRADHRLAFIRAAGVEWPQQMQEYLKNHHIVVEVGVVCLADVSLSPGWTECFASEVGPRLILRISDIWPLRCLSDRLVRWKILLWDVADAARSLGERLVKGSLVIVLSFPGMGLMGAPMPASAQNLRRNGQLWTTSEGLVVTLGPVKGSTVKPGPP